MPTVPLITLPMKKDILEEIIGRAKNWAIMHGISLRAKPHSEDFNFIPFVLLPTAFPLPEFEKSLSLQPILNELMHSVAHDYEFLKETLKDTIETDAFTKHLFDIYEAVQAEGVAQDISLGILRSDYMLDTNDSNQIKQVEINTIASGFASYGAKLNELYKFVLSDLGHNEQIKTIPENESLAETTLGLVKAWELYNKRDSVILFVINHASLIVCDVHFHLFEIRRRNPDIKVIERSLSQIADSAQLGPNKELLVEGYEIAVAFYRTGFKPLETQKEWDARLLIERSLAIKCPSIHYQLVGTKKVQQALANQNILEKYIKSSKTVKSVMDIFTGLYSLGFHENAEEVICKALLNPEKYVLKAEGDGGGNNLYENDIRDALLKMQGRPERKAWILMDKINAPASEGYVIRSRQLGLPDLVKLSVELGVYGVIVGNSRTILHNKSAGYMCRYKSVNSNSGGILRGDGAVGGIYLVE